MTKRESPSSYPALAPAVGVLILVLLPSCNFHKAEDDIAAETIPNAKLVSMTNEAIESELKALREAPATCAQCKATAGASFDGYLRTVAEASLWCAQGKTNDKHNAKNVRVRGTTGTPVDLRIYHSCTGAEAMFRITFTGGRASGVFTDGAEKRFGPETMLAPLREMIDALKSHDRDLHADAYTLSKDDQKRKTGEAWSK